MKFTLFLLAAALCLLSVNAGTKIEPRSIEDMEFLPSDVAEVEGIDVDSFWIFSGVWWAIKGALRTVKGFNCLIKWVVGIKGSALQFNDDLVACHVEMTTALNKLVQANKNIISTSNDIINLKTNVCNTTEGDKPSVSNKCGVQTLVTVFKLYKQVKTAISLAKKIPQTGSNANACVTAAVTTLTTYYTQFPQNIKQCSKLTN